MLDQHLTQHRTWVKVHEAMDRRTARVRRKIARALRVEAAEGCVDETATHMAEDEAILARWRRAQGISEDLGDVRSPIIQRLDVMARRCSRSAPDAG